MTEKKKQPAKKAAPAKKAPAKKAPAKKSAPAKKAAPKKTAQPKPKEDITPLLGTVSPQTSNPFHEKTHIEVTTHVPAPPAPKKKSFFKRLFGR